VGFCFRSLPWHRVRRRSEACALHRVSPRANWPAPPSAPLAGDPGGSKPPPAAGARKAAPAMTRETAGGGDGSWCMASSATFRQRSNSSAKEREKNLSAASNPSQGVEQTICGQTGMDGELRRVAGLQKPDGPLQIGKVVASFTRKLVGVPKPSPTPLCTLKNESRTWQTGPAQSRTRLPSDVPGNVQQVAVEVRWLGLQDDKDEKWKEFVRT
jgi:hypothetical protein